MSNLISNFIWNDNKITVKPQYHIMRHFYHFRDK
jgi:hypothetical protein